MNPADIQKLMAILSSGNKQEDQGAPWRETYSPIKAFLGIPQTPGYETENSPKNQDSWAWMTEGALRNRNNPDLAAPIIPLPNGRFPSKGRR